MRREEVDQLQSKALEQFRSGKSLFGKDGAFAPVPKHGIATKTKQIVKRILNN